MSLLAWPGWALRLWALRRRRAGRYERSALAALFAAWQAKPSPAHLLAWASLRRDLGRPLSGRMARGLLHALPALRPASRGRAMGLLAEHDAGWLMGQPIPHLWRVEASRRLPALASLLVGAEGETRLEQVAAMQSVWRSAFAKAVQGAAHGAGMAVVGNAAALQGCGLGKALDACGMVVRFNQFPQAQGAWPDVGRQLHVWMVAPGYKGPVPARVDWVVLSGPAMEFRLSDWSALAGLVKQGTPVLTVPLSAWAHCVRVLRAPPSAGVLVLWWLHELCGGDWAGLTSAGIGMGTQLAHGYHLGLPKQRPAARHHWQGEAQLVDAWRRQGLRTLGAASAGLPMRLVASGALARIPALEVLAGGTPGVAAWGRKPSAAKAVRHAEKLGLPSIQFEDGFIRSYGAGAEFPPLALVVDAQGIYYDATQPSALETLLNFPGDLLLTDPGANFGTGAASTPRGVLQTAGLSKYNHAPAFDSTYGRLSNDGMRVLVVDQTAGDLSVEFGCASAATFTDMLAAARAENPEATIYVKTHPEVSSGRKRGYLTHIQDDERTVVLREAINPLSLIEHMDRVYVVTSTMGFEALLAGKPVTCFGVPWYAGWGVTDDRVKDSPAWARRTRKRTVDELFAAAYIHYTRYLNPETHERGTIMDVIGWLVRQKEMAGRMHGDDRKGRVLGIGMRRWKAMNLKPLLGLHTAQVLFTRTAQAAQALQPGPGDTLAFWGAAPPPGLAELARHCQARILHVEDGFVRSVGLGSDLIAPRSLVLDERGIYFDATRPSDLEVLLNDGVFTVDELAEAKRVREFIVQHGITKYNLEPREAAHWPVPAGRPVVVVPGQVEDDASIRLGCTDVRTNLALLQAVRTARPEAFIVYKPHPDVASGNRRGRMGASLARQWADHVETRLSIISCIEACDEVHTMTSLAGFDALLRGKRVVTYGQPFYAGWGLTEDRCQDGPAFSRRHRRLTLDELVVGALLRYPLYWDPVLKGYTTCMAVLRQLAAERDGLEREGKLERLRAGAAWRLLRKARVLARAFLGNSH